MVFFAKARRKDRAGTCIAEWWHLVSWASRDEFVSLAHCQLVLPYPFLHPVTCWCFPREPGAVTCRGSHPSKHVSTCWDPVDVSETGACY